MKLLLALLLAVGSLRSSTQEGADQDYEVTNESFELIDGDKETLVNFSGVNTVKRQRYFNGSFVVVEDLDDDQFKIGVEMYTSPTGDGNYKKMAMDVPPMGLCEVLKKMYREFVQPAMKFGDNTNFPHVGEDGLCPFPSGTYYIKEISMDTSSWPSHMAYGTLKAVVTWFKNDVVVGGFIIKLKIQRKP